jgi:hypothetical protein
LVVFFNEFKKVVKLIHESGLITYINWLIKSLLVPSKALLRLAGDLADSGFRGIIRAYYVRRGFGALSIEFIIYRRPSSSRRLLARIRRALEALPSLVAAVMIGFILVLIVRWII